MYDIQLVSKRVEREIRKFDRKEQENVEFVLKILGNNPRPVDLQFGSVNRNSDVKRIKSKRLRVFYKIDEFKKTIFIGKIDNRDSKSYSVDPSQWFSA